MLFSKCSITQSNMIYVFYVQHIQYLFSAPSSLSVDMWVSNCLSLSFPLTHLLFTCLFLMTYMHKRPNIMVRKIHVFGLQKKMDFTLKVIGGDIKAIPGLSDAIEVCQTSTVGFSLFFSLWDSDLQPGLYWYEQYDVLINEELSFFILYSALDVIILSR